MSEEKATSDIEKDLAKIAAKAKAQGIKVKTKVGKSDIPAKLKSGIRNLPSNIKTGGVFFWDKAVNLKDKVVEVKDDRKERKKEKRAFFKSAGGKMDDISERLKKLENKT